MRKRRITLDYPMIFVASSGNIVFISRFSTPFLASRSYPVYSDALGDACNPNVSYLYYYVVVRYFLGDFLASVS